VAILWAILVIAGLPVLGHAQTPATQPAAPSRSPFGNVDLIGALKQVPGCLGVEAARTASGKQVIFAWFENKAALLRWYSSDTHVQLMNTLTPNRPAHVPLADVPDDSGPILTIASLTPAPNPVAGQPPFAQIAIELYRPLSGGIAVGGKFAPDALKVPGLREIAMLPSAK
jgi:hypothetical protein